MREKLTTGKGSEAEFIQRHHSSTVINWTINYSIDIREEELSTILGPAEGLAQNIFQPYNY